MPEPTAPRALLVEDNLMFAMMVEPALKRLGYQVKIVGSAQSAAQAAAELAPAVIFVNLASNRVDGVGVVRALKADPSLAGTPVIGYAGHVERQFFQQGREAGATLVVPNSAMRKSLPEVLRKLQNRLAGEAEQEWPEDE
jgi:CheY-like chemotaxis protein